MSSQVARRPTENSDRRRWHISDKHWLALNHACGPYLHGRKRVRDYVTIMGVGRAMLHSAKLEPTELELMVAALGGSIPA